MPGAGVTAVAVEARVGDSGPGSASAARVLPALHGRHVDSSGRRVVVEVVDRLHAPRAASRGQGPDGTASVVRRGLASREGSQARRPVEGVETRGIEPLTPALQNRPRGGLARWAVTENPS